MANTTRPVTLDHLVSKKKPVIRSVWIAGDDELAEKYLDEVKKRDFLASIHRRNPEDQATATDLRIAETRVSEAEAEVRESSLRFKFRSIGRSKFEKLVSDHPPTAENFAEVEALGMDPKDLRWNTDTFSVALCAASSYEPVMSVAEVRSLFDSEDWNQAECAALFSTALTVNMERRSLNLDAVGNGSRGTNGSS